MQSRPLVRAVCSAAVVAVLAALAGCAPTGAKVTTHDLRAANTLSWAGFAPMQPLDRPHFTMTDTSGAAYDFYARTRGKVTLLYFGYTHCADICPITMHMATDALHRLSSADRAKVTLVFVSTDPDRDTGPVIRRWLDAMDPSYVGLRGTHEQVHAAEVAAGLGEAGGGKAAHGRALSSVLLAAGARLPMHGAGDQAEDHPAQLLLYGTDDKAHLVYDDQTKATDLASDLRQVVSGAEPAPPSMDELEATGASGRSGMVKVAAARLMLSSAEGHPAYLDVTLVNSGSAPVDLTGVTTPAGTVVVQGAGGVPAPGGVRTTIGSRDDVAFAPGGPRLVLDHPAASLTTGLAVPVTFTFSSGAVVRLQVPAVHG